MSWLSIIVNVCKFSMGTDPASTDKCPVCFEPFSSSDSVIGHTTGNAVSHLFHTKCAEAWFDKGGSCPTCRQPLEGRMSPHSPVALVRTLISSISRVIQPILGLFHERPISVFSSAGGEMTVEHRSGTQLMSMIWAFNILIRRLSVDLIGWRRILGQFISSTNLTS